MILTGLPLGGCRFCRSIKNVLVSAMGMGCFVVDECGGSGGEADSDEDIVTEYQVASVVAGGMRPGSGQGGHGPLPTISVTPHSPANKTYPVLEDSLRQVRDLSETVHQMRHQSASQSSGVPSIKAIPVSALNPFLTQVARLSASCPALNEVMTELETLGGSLGSSPMHPPLSRKNSGAQDWLRQPDANRQRRRSWTALEDLREGREKVKQRRQRSVSLSSMESEADESIWENVDNIDGSTVRLLGPERPIPIRHRVNRTSGGGASTHSLNEADLQNDFNKVKAKREAEQLRLSPQRLPLQKSISTPSIIAAGDLVVEPTLVGAQPTLPMARPSCTESETEEESVQLVRASYNSHIIHKVGYDRHSEKRRKRGSLFFRKKKDKSKKLHQWVSACYGSSQVCDSCNKELSNKPALYCECCGTTVHQNTCKDNIVECTKPKGMKSSGKLGAFSVTLPNNKNSMSKRGSGTLPGMYNSSSQILMGDDKDNDHHGHHESVNYPDDVPLVPLEFLSDSPLTASDLCSDYSLGFSDAEPESWSQCVGREITKKLKEKEIKRQEHIYEFILTEKHHCMILLVMQKIFVEGLQKHFQLGPNLERMFPRLADLIELHLGFLSRLRQKQREGPIINSIADILLDMFSGAYATKLKSAYGELCSRHGYALEINKYYMQNDPRFGQFVRHCQQNPLLKKRGISECILFVTHRLTKYPLLIEPLIKTSKDNKPEQDTLQKSLALVKEILVEVNAQVAEKEQEDRKLEIYNRIDAKSYTIHRGHKFKKSDILQGNRSLKFEGVAMLMQGRGKMQLVLVIVLSDVLFFLQENSHKYTFFTPDNKYPFQAGVVSLQKLLVREKAGQDSRGIYLISSNPAEPEMFELKIHKPKDKQTWIQAIRKAVQTCPEDDEEELALSSDEKLVLLHKQNQIKHIVGLLRQKDVEQALLLEEKMSLQLRLMAVAGLDPPSPPSYRHLVSETANTEKMWKEVLMAVQEVTHLASSLYTTGTNLSRSVSSAGEHHSDTYVSPVLPKRAETFGGFDNSNQVGFRLFNRKSCSPDDNSPKNEFENLKPHDSKLLESLPFRNYVMSGTSITNGNSNNNEVSIANPAPPTDANLLSLGREQQYAAIQLSHYVYTLLCIISQLMTTNECLQAEAMAIKNTDGSKQYKHNQQLEELRNLQDKLSKEKAEWATQKEQEMQEMEEKRKELQRIQEQIKIEQNDIKQQREQLYRKMEILTSQGLLISPNIALPVTGQIDDSSKETSEENSPQSDSSTSNSNSLSGSTYSTSTVERKKDSKWNKGSSSMKSQLPVNLMSTTNQYKVSQSAVKQQLPLKLASRLSAGSINTGTGNSPVGVQQVLPLKLSQHDEKERRTSTSGYQRLGSDSFSPTSGETTPTLPHAHSRTGSSPALIQQCSSPTGQSSQSIPQSPSNKASRTNTYPKFPDKFRVRSNHQHHHQQQQQNTEEEVIYF
ncbi:rho guanine nucleotide exchange factor 18 isoform X3 [Coccinella septempunctata]|uniref:rho guanine nucleotide exchange factor 18 isoform X3 n=1 Tax=Coccinella septempunctata TaxID=41139 RepID=UPI001D05DF01|nr:rho guanine nucleotide exchange factor 18 isoform X3 [Coccinella septempunctata]